MEAVPAAAAAAAAVKQKAKKHIHLFYCSECEELALKIAASSDAIELQSINWRSFDDGFPNLFINKAHDIRGQHVAFLASFSSPAVIFEQISVIFALPKLFIASFTLVLPFFPTGSFERVEEEGDVATAFTLARILSMIPKSRGGPTSVVIYDIHALQERFYFGDDVLPCFETGIPLLLQRLRQLPDADNITIAFPDDGAWKRFHKLLQHFPMIVCNKVREGDKRIVRIKEGNPEGRHVVIVDDLVQSGGTLRECQKVLASHGAAKVSAYVTHAVFPKNSYERFMASNSAGPGDQFAYFWITDSCPHTVKAIGQRPPFETLELVPSINAVLAFVDREALHKAEPAAPPVVTHIHKGGANVIFHWVRTEQPLLAELTGWGVLVVHRENVAGTEVAKGVWVTGQPYPSTQVMVEVATIIKRQPPCTVACPLGGLHVEGEGGKPEALLPAVLRHADDHGLSIGVQCVRDDGVVRRWRRKRAPRRPVRLDVIARSGGRWRRRRWSGWKHFESGSSQEEELAV
ncbi:hypothetical protein U9M48_022205 [Paspalum notatum var. saurae]|uniref:ribose-phosphate diphosphokinase n=1 Tax=Paspalum notatum var. saurae TaxID=547442 RepID=A0AAQ3TKM0_PASNO